MADRNSFLDRIREETARGRAYRVASNPEATASAAYVGGGPDLVESFLREWIAVGGQGARVTSIAAARDFVREFLSVRAVRRAIRWRHPVLEKLALDELLVESHVESLPWDELEGRPPAARWSDTFAADLGITSADWAVAETGSLALCAQSGQGRVVSLLPAIYLAIFEARQIIPDLFDLFDALETRKANLPSNIALVTGPSKTGDIELKLTTGVHGPGDVTVLIIE